MDIARRRLAEVVMVRRLSALGYSRASYELNLGCNWDCEHCYLGLKQFRGLAWDQREELLHTIRDAGVVYLQLTGGEPLIDRLFCETYELARLGMMLHISTNGSRLHNPRILELLTTCPPYRITVSAYGATEASYNALVRRPGAFRLFSRGMAAALEAGLPLRLNIVLTKTNAHEQNAMIAMAERWGRSTSRRRHHWSTTASTEGGRCHDRGHGQDRAPPRRHAGGGGRPAGVGAWALGPARAGRLVVSAYPQVSRYAGCARSDLRVRLTARSGSLVPCDTIA